MEGGVSITHWESVGVVGDTEHLTHPRNAPCGVIASYPNIEPVAVSGHLTLCDGVHVTGMTTITRSITQPGVYSSGLHAMEDGRWKKSQARFRDLDDLARRLFRLEKAVGRNTEN